MIGIVIIGRNEGQRLKLCIESALLTGYPVVYADSNSSDGSVLLARTAGAHVVCLDPLKPMNASRGRKEGFEKLRGLFPNIEYVFFLDGDCVLNPAFLPEAIEVFQSFPNVAAVCGRRSEEHPNKSVYHKAADLEWNTPVGDASSCGGDALMNVAAYILVGGFDESVLAGEEPELCARLRRQGFSIKRIDVGMSVHDINMSTLGQWWKRGVRGGYGACDVYQRFDLVHFKKQLVSSRLWVLGWPALTCIVVAIAVIVGGIYFGIVALCLSFILVCAQVLRIAGKAYKKGVKFGDAIVYGCLMMVNKVACLVGQVRWFKERACIDNSVRTTSRWRNDLLRYPKRPFLKEQSIWAIAVHRWGFRLFSKPTGLLRSAETTIYWGCFRLVETFTGISLPGKASIGGGLKIYHFGNVFVHPSAIIGSNCTLRQGVTIGNRSEGGPAPIVGNDVEFGAYAQVLGGVRIGDRCKIGAMAVVLSDVPSDCTAVGNPARIIESQ